MFGEAVDDCVDAATWAMFVGRKDRVEKAHECVSSGLSLVVSLPGGRKSLH